MPPPAAIYLRVSTDDQAREGVSLDAQDARCRAYCTAAGLTVSEILREEGVSAATPLSQRPLGRRIVHLVQSGAVTAVVSLKLDRLFRSASDALATAETWDRAGVALHLVDMGGTAVNTRSATGRLFFTVLAGMAECERALTAERITLSMGHIVASGRFCAGDILGYIPDPDPAHKGIIPDPTSAWIVQRVYAEYARGDSQTAIVQRLNGEGLRAKRGGLWTLPALRRLLDNPTYIGLLRWRGEIIPGSHEPLVSREMWTTVAARRASAERRGSHDARSLAALWTCGLCGSSLQSVSYPDRATQSFRCYRCAGLPAAQRHRPWSFGGDKLMAALWRHTELLLASGELSEGLDRGMGELSQAREDLPRLRARVDELTAQRDVLLEAAMRGIIGMDELGERAAPLLEERTSLQETIKRAQEPPGRAETAFQTPPSEALAELRERGTRAEQMAFLRSIYATMSAYPDRIELTYVPQISLPPATRPLPTYWRPGLRLPY
jgi:DNA invertase Pin-like site-specific DNA recombinase